MGTVSPHHSSACGGAHSARVTAPASAGGCDCRAPFSQHWPTLGHWTVARHSGWRYSTRTTGSPTHSAILHSSVMAQATATRPSRADVACFSSSFIAHCQSAQVRTTTPWFLRRVLDLVTPMPGVLRPLCPVLWSGGKVGPCVVAGGGGGDTPTPPPQPQPDPGRAPNMKVMRQRMICNVFPGRLPPFLSGSTALFCA